MKVGQRIDFHRTSIYIIVKSKLDMGKQLGDKYEVGHSIFSLEYVDGEVFELKYTSN